MDPSDTNLANVAVEEARRSRQEANRTPLFVGAVAARGAGLIAKAHRGEEALGEHAEFILLERKLKSERLAGATLFTTPEPCTKRGPGKVPCADRIIERRFSRVVIGTLDPNPDIRGKGVLALRQAGITVELFPPRPDFSTRRAEPGFFPSPACRRSATDSYSRISCRGRKTYPRSVVCVCVSKCYLLSS
jgi:pyrimidine deaminase RibD-like protein